MDVGEYIVPVPHVKQVKVGRHYKMSVICSFFCGVVKVVSFSLVISALKCRRKADNGI